MLPDESPNQARALRLQANVTLAVVAQKIGVHPMSLSQFERTGRGLGRMRQMALADVLNVDIPMLLTPGKKFAEKIRQMPDYPLTK